MKKCSILLTILFINMNSIMAQDKYFQILDNGDIQNIPSPTSSKTDFDFYEGSWNIHNKKLKTRLNNCNEWIEFDAKQTMNTILNGLGNIDHFFATFDGKPFEGLSLRLFNPETKLWAIYWADNNTGVLQPPVYGSFYGNLGIFVDKDKFNGKDIIVKFEWDKSDKENPIWRQAFSDDNGKTWEYNWYMFISKDESYGN
jgi:hypothetical protein